jgi:hypothetical protein
MIYTSECNNLNIVRYDVLFILRLITGGPILGVDH